ncbi:MAG: cysteine desulfurase [Clostridiales Family XIII bacterium]|jgi:cysteine desulfurase|nr:cysteine desulfurase [Clostridiales Family XIII bacterium]
MKIYLDNSATTKVYPEVAEAMRQAMTETYANPSSLHKAGQEAERLMKLARQQISFAINSKPASIIFTSGGSESNNMALRSAYNAQAREKKKAIAVSSVEHPSVSITAGHIKGPDSNIFMIPVRRSGENGPGAVDVTAFRQLLDDQLALVAVMHVNNEIGTIQPIDEISRLLNNHINYRDIDIPLHVDAVQSFGKIPIDVASGDLRRAAYISMSAHKIGGPKGSGALFAANPARVRPLIYGGGQEGGLRSGTENIPGIVGLSVAARIATSDYLGHANAVERCRATLLAGIKSEIGDILINSPEKASVRGEPYLCSPYILNVSFLGTKGEVVLHELERSGIYVSTGSACSSNMKPGKDKMTTLRAIGLKPEAEEGAVRFSFSPENNVRQMEFVIDRLKKAVDRFRRIDPAGKRNAQTKPAGGPVPEK